MIKNHKFQILLNVVTIVIVGLMLLASRALAAPGGTPDAQTSGMDVLAYQGTLVDAAGTPVSGSVGMVFRIYNHPTEGGALWAEAHTGANAVPVQNGLFNVTLGSLTPISDPVWQADPLYLGVQIEGESEMTPREAIHLLPPRIEMGSLDAGVLKTDSLGEAAFPNYYFERSSSIIYLKNKVTGINTQLDTAACPSSGWCCNPEQTICLLRSSTDPNILAFRMEETHSVACWLAHHDDDYPTHSLNLGYATDTGISSPLGGGENFFFFTRDTTNDLPMWNNAAYQIICLK
jgi:hypothetical protein